MPTGTVKKSAATSSAIGYLLATTILAAVGLASGCTSFGASVEDGPPPTTPQQTEAGATDANERPTLLDDSGAPADAADAADEKETGKCPNGTPPIQIALSASADTSFTDECNVANDTRGSARYMHLGDNAGMTVGLVRFALSQQDAEFLKKHTLVGGRLELFASSDCALCPSQPTLQGQIAVHSMRSDWDENADRCRRAPSAGWGLAGNPGKETPIAGGGVDFDDGPDTTTVPDGADAIAIPLRASTITARGSIAATGMIAFYLRMATGRMAVSTREQGAGAAPHLVVSYCK